MRSLLLGFLRSLQTMVNLLLWVVVLGLFASFGLQFQPVEKRESVLLTDLLHSVWDPAIAKVGSWFDLSWPAPDGPGRWLPLGMAIAIWMVRVWIREGLERSQTFLKPEQPASTQRRQPPTPLPREPEPEGVTRESGKAREGLLKRYREITKALKSAEPRSCAFLSLDVVGSTQMKSGESPTRVAASFQVYEEMLRRIFKKHSAWKQSWNPEGVLVCFLQREKAVAAGQHVLKRLQDFNATVNQLRTPFCVRCGVHQGEVAIFDDSKLEAISDPVIDVAGHMQNRARENALWLAEEVYKSLPDGSGFRATSLMVDGHNAYEWSLEPPREAPQATATVPTVAAPPAKVPAPPVEVPAPRVKVPGPPVKATAPLEAPARVERPAQVSPGATGKVQRIGRYEILEELGRGAVAVVYKALDPQIGRIVALKVIRTQGLAPEELRTHKERFFREARAAGKMMHPGIVAIYDVAEDPSGTLYLVMEFVEGKTLEQALSPENKGEPVSFSQRLTLAVEVAEALDYAHHRDVVHRDVKPANILITQEGHAKITDFGIAKLVGSQSTIGGQVLGTPVYVSPEQLTCSVVDARSDIFSLGVVMYWMFTGDKPFAGDTLAAITYKVMNVMPVPARELNRALPKDLEKMLLRCLAKKPPDRYQSASELAGDLQALRDGKLQTERRPA